MFIMKKAGRPSNSKVKDGEFAIEEFVHVSSQL